MAEISDHRETDLFGNPVRANHGRRGRPSLQISDQDRDMVEAALARGWSNQRIAETVGISPASLKRHFRAALAKRDIARDRLEIALFARTAREALAGNMTAAKQLREWMDRDAMTRRKVEMAQRQAEADAAGVGTLGKKEAAQRAAEQAMQDGDDWGDLLNPTGYEH